jgi:hypothetical protein
MRRLILVLFLIMAVVVPAGVAGQVTAPKANVADEFVSAAPPEPLSEPVMTGLAAIRAQALGAHIAFLASPALEGRGLDSRGLGAALEYVAAGLALAGIPPLTDGEGNGAHASYFQNVPLREISAASGQITVERRTGEEAWSRSFRSGVDCVLPELAPQTLRAPVVFAGYGIREQALGHDDYRGLDLRGKVVLIFGGLPPGPEWQTPELRSRYGAEETGERYGVKLETARTLGAAAVLAVEGEHPVTSPADEEHLEERFFLPFDIPNTEQAPLVRVSPPVAEALLAAAGLHSATARTARPRDLPGVTVTIKVNGEERLVTSRNVVGVLAGSDPKLREKAVVMGAHADHLGRIGDAIYPGADDNASGVAALLEIAKALAALPERPKRTLVFAFWTGEEEGKLGSGYWVRHPLWPLARTDAYLNLDMIGHPWSLEEIKKLVGDVGLPGTKEFLAGVKPVDFAEPGLPPDAPEIASALRRAAPATGMALHLDFTDGTGGGSDYRDFARAHVPFVRFFGNFFPAYHEPGDTPEALDATQVERMARLAFATAWLLANR